MKDKTCIPCRGGVDPLTGAEACGLLQAVPGWELIANSSKLRRTFTFVDFKQAQAFALQVGMVAEAENHHPDIQYGWGYCSVVFFTHKIAGLHHNDFIMAAKVNSLSDNSRAIVLKYE